MVQPDPAFAADNQAWRVQRYQELTRPDGWTSLVGLHWLSLKAHYIGSGADSGIRLAVGPAKMGLVSRRRSNAGPALAPDSHRGGAGLARTASPGGGLRVAPQADGGAHRRQSSGDATLASSDGDEVWFTPEPGVALTVDGRPLVGRIRFHSDRDPQPTTIGFDDGKGLLTLIRRGDRHALRLKHADAPSRTGFTGLDYWPLDESWRIKARFVPNAAGKTLPIVDIVGITTEMANAGAVEFERDGHAWRLQAIGEPGQELFVIFADRTSGHGSYPAGRYIDLPAPDANGEVTIDFNRAYNPPCAFTPFATCPLPPPENRLDLRVDAGEKNYRKPH
ncbi:DUF1684 domain-containing protein [Stenotrophomonas sp. MMGLT7]|uniref:DUF1684 domain-containing protein n=1 Tax=Stenotrophomonas sp. MMGLT7 TaxID=2901227 RepID=UPI002F915B48